MDFSGMTHFCKNCNWAEKRELARRRRPEKANVLKVYGAVDQSSWLPKGWQDFLPWTPPNPAASATGFPIPKTSPPVRITINFYEPQN